MMTRGYRNATNNKRRQNYGRRYLSEKLYLGPTKLPEEAPDVATDATGAIAAWGDIAAVEAVFEKRRA